MRRIAWVLAAAAVLWAGAASAADTVRIVNIGHGYWAGPLYVAEAERLFAKHGLAAEVTTVKGGSLAFQALFTKDADVAMLNYEHIVQALANGRRAVAVYRMIHRPVNNVIIKTEIADKTAGLDIAERVRRLKGLRIGLPSAGGSGEKMLGVLARKYGLRLPGDIDTVFLGSDPGPYVAAFKQGLIDAALPVEPTGILIEQEGLGKTYINLMTGEVPEFDNLITMVLAVHPDLMESNPRLIQRVVAVLDDAMAVLKKNPARGKEIMRKIFPTLSAAAHDATYRTLLQIWTDHGRMTAAEGQRVVDYLLGGGEQAAPSLNLQLTFTNKFLPN